jgi:hypothetical protein
MSGNPNHRRQRDRTYRIRNIPLFYSTDELEQVILSSLKLSGCRLRIKSLATDIDLGTHRKSQTATAYFQVTAEDSHSAEDFFRSLGNRFILEVPREPGSRYTSNLSFDSDFLGYTPLSPRENGESYVAL